jgi:hypothetical protein
MLTGAEGWWFNGPMVCAMVFNRSRGCVPQLGTLAACVRPPPQSSSRPLDRLDRVNKPAAWATTRRATSSATSSATSVASAFLATSVSCIADETRQGARCRAVRGGGRAGMHARGV